MSERLWSICLYLYLCCRFERKIEVPAPDAAARAAFFETTQRRPEIASQLGWETFSFFLFPTYRRLREMVPRGNSNSLRLLGCWALRPHYPASPCSILLPAARARCSTWWS